jgi:hypothetical protein
MSSVVPSVVRRMSLSAGASLAVGAPACVLRVGHHADAGP